MPTIAKSAIEKFSSRKLEDYRWIKKKSKKHLMSEIAQIAPKYKFKTDPWAHQAACTFIGSCVNSFLYFLDMGAGKSKIILDVFAIRKRLGESDKMLVVVDNLINIYTWVENIEEHSRFKKVCALDSTIEGRREEIAAGDADIYVINYAGLVHLLCKRKENKKKGNTKLVPDYKAAVKLAKMFGMMVLDEIHYCKNKDSLAFRLLRKMGQYIKYRYGATGTPIGNKKEDIWAVFYLIDHGETFGPTLGLFRAVYCTEVPGWGGSTKYEFNDDMFPAFIKAMQNRSISYDEAELGDMPKRSDIIVPIPMTNGVRSYYGMVKKKLVEYHKAGGAIDKLEIKNTYVRLRQVMSGFIGLDNEGVKIEAEFGSNKTVWIEDSIDEMLATKGKIIFFHEFRPSGRLIANILKKKKIPYIQIGGGVGKGKDKAALGQKFKTDLKYRVAVVNLQSGATGWNPQTVANKLIYFELTPKVITFLQSIKRVYRRTQKRRVKIWFLITKDSAEEAMLKTLKEGKDVVDAVMAGKIAEDV